jgi:hypothetical protein
MTRRKKKTTPHAKTENVSLFGLRTPFGPVGLIVMAERYLRAAQIVRSQRPPQEQWSPVEKFLACRTIELSLKAFLSLKGRPLTELGFGEFGHDLQNLLAEADAVDLSKLVDLSEEDRSVIEFVHRYYLDKVFEYPAVLEALKGYPGDPETEPLLNVGARLVAGLMQPCCEHGPKSVVVDDVIVSASKSPPV